MIDKAHVLEYCSFASGGSGGLGVSGWDGESPELACVRKVDDKGKSIGENCRCEFLEIQETNWFCDEAIGMPVGYCIPC